MKKQLSTTIPTLSVQKAPPKRPQKSELNQFAEQLLRFFAETLGKTLQPSSASPVRDVKVESRRSQ